MQFNIINAMIVAFQANVVMMLVGVSVMQSPPWGLVVAVVLLFMVCLVWNVYTYAQYKERRGDFDQ